MRQKKQSISELLPLLVRQTGEQKLRIAFDLSRFVNKLRKTGESYAKTVKRSRAGRAA